VHDIRCEQNLRWPFLRATTYADDSWIVRSSDGGPRAHYTFVSLHGSDHDGVVRIFVALSCELRLFTLD